MKAVAGWLAVMLVVAVAGMRTAAWAAAQTQYFHDPLNQYDAAYGYTLPVHLIQAAHPGWPILAAVWLTLALLGFAGFRLALALEGAALPFGAAIACSFAVALAFSFGVVVQSVDVYYYITFGLVYGVHGLNPYFLIKPFNVAGDTTLSQVLGYVHNPPYNDPYGPLWTLLAGAFGKAISALTLYWQVWAYRFVAIAAGVVTLAGVARALRSVSGPERTRRVALVGLHPLFLYETAVGAHNEILMVAPAVWAFAVVDELPLVAALLMGASIAIKYLSVVVLPFLLWRIAARSRVAGILALVIALGIPVLCFKPFWVGSAALNATAGHLNGLGMSPTWLLALPFFASDLGKMPAFGVPIELPYLGLLTWPRLVQLVVVAAFLVVAAWSFVRYMRDGCLAHVWRTLTAFFWASPIIHPWYLLMLTPAIAGRGRWAAYTWWFCALIPLRYVLETVAAAPTSVLVVLTILFLASPIIIALYGPPWEADSTRLQ